MRKRKIKILTFLSLISATVIGCSSQTVVSEEIVGSYESNHSNIHIESNGEVLIKEPVTTDSLLSRSLYIIPKESADDGLYVMNPDKDYSWTYTIDKNDPQYMDLMTEMAYYIDNHGFNKSETDDTVTVSGVLDDVYFETLDISYDDPVISDLNDGLYLYSTKISD